MVDLFHKSTAGDQNEEVPSQAITVMHNGSKEGIDIGKEHQAQNSILPTHRVNHNGHKVHKYIHPDGESGREWLHPWHFIRICFRSSCDASCIVNVLWPIVPVAVALNYARTDL